MIEGHETRAKNVLVLQFVYVSEVLSKLKGNCNHRLENSRLQTGCLQTGHFEMPRFLCSELQRLD